MYPHNRFNLATLSVKKPDHAAIINGVDEESAPKIFQA